MSDPDYNWIVPARRVVIKKKTTYAQFIEDWWRLLAFDVGWGAALWAWYSNDVDGELTMEKHRVGVKALQHWRQTLFEGGKVQTSTVGTTSAEIESPDFHARLWKGPRRILDEQRARDRDEDPQETQTFDLVGGRLVPRMNEALEPMEVELQVGDVLEVALHVFLSACGLSRFDAVEFDPEGSFYLGTTVRDRNGRPRLELPRLHDNMLAMRYQLVTALNMANCYHDSAVYTSKVESDKDRLMPEGAGLYARGMPFGGNPSAGFKEGTFWEFNQMGACLPRDARPRHMTVPKQMDRFVEGLPLTWGWTCSPFTLFLMGFMCDAHQTAQGTRLPSGAFLSKSLGISLLMSTSDQKCKDRRAKQKEFYDEHPGDPLLLHNLTPDDVEPVREYLPPLADLINVAFPEDRPTQAGWERDGERFRSLPQPDNDTAVDRTWDEVCPDAGLVIVSCGSGHEWAYVKLYPSARILNDVGEAIAAMDEAAGPDSIPVPVAGRMSAYNPLSGEDYCDAPGVLQDGQYFHTESGARMHTRSYFNMKLDDTAVHKFFATPQNKLRFKRATEANVDKKKKKKKKDKDEKNDPYQLWIKVEEHQSDKGKPADASTHWDKVDQGWSGRAVSSIFFVREGEPGSDDPRTLANIYDIPREQWTSARFKLPDPKASSPVSKFLKRSPQRFAERAIPFPTLMEVAPGLPDTARVSEQFDNHRAWIASLGGDGVTDQLEAKLKVATKKRDKDILKADIKVSKDGVLRQQLLDLLAAP